MQVSVQWCRLNSTELSYTKQPTKLNETKLNAGIREVVGISISKAATTYEINSLKAIEYMTYVQWTLIAIPHMLYTRGLVSWLQFEQVFGGGVV